MIELREHEAVGGDGQEYRDRLNERLGCASFFVWGLVGMAGAGAVLIGVLNLVRLAGR